MPACFAFVPPAARLLVAAVALASLGLVAASADPAAPIPAAPACTNPDALGTSRVLQVGTEGGLAVGLKTYPRTLELGDHEVVLTFDDGPFPATTGPILAALAKECVHATFFLVGRNAAANPVFVRDEIRAGHTVGHHSFSHPDVTLRGLSDAVARSEIDRGIAADDRAAGYPVAATGSPEPHVPFFRFPGFGDTQALRDWLAQRRIAVFGADLWASDWNLMTPQAELKLLMERLETKGRGIILLHDTKPQTAEMLPNFLRALKAKGYKVVALQPAAGTTETTPAPQGWVSETEESLKKIMPKLLAAAAHVKATPGAQHASVATHAKAANPRLKGTLPAPSDQPDDGLPMQ